MARMLQMSMRRKRAMKAPVERRLSKAIPQFLEVVRELGCQGGQATFGQYLKRVETAGALPRTSRRSGGRNRNQCRRGIHAAIEQPAAGIHESLTPKRQGPAIRTCRPERGPEEVRLKAANPVDIHIRSKRRTVRQTSPVARSVGANRRLDRLALEGSASGANRYPRGRIDWPARSSQPRRAMPTFRG